MKKPLSHKTYCFMFHPEEHTLKQKLYVPFCCFNTLLDTLSSMESYFFFIDANHFRFRKTSLPFLTKLSSASYFQSWFFINLFDILGHFLQLRSIPLQFISGLSISFFRFKLQFLFASKNAAQPNRLQISNMVLPQSLPRAVSHEFEAYAFLR